MSETDSPEVGVLPASFRPWIHSAGSQTSFIDTLSRLYHERGHFRHITELQLREEIALKSISANPPFRNSQHDPASPAHSSTASDTDDEGPTNQAARPKDIQVVRNNLLQQISSAQNEILIALDFVSLLLSKDLKHAESTISPILKQSVPSGTLGIDMWANMPEDLDRVEQDKILARGCRTRALRGSADALMKASTRLNNTVRREDRYWREITKVQKDGWAICRVPRQKGLLGVKYGFPESRGQFASRGMAILRSGDQGQVVLDNGMREEKQLRVRIVQDGRVRGQNILKRIAGIYDEIGPRIRLARQCLFDQELWHEMMQEARDLDSYGVTLDGNTIKIPLTLMNNQTCSEMLMIDLVPLQKRNKNEVFEMEVFADGMAETLRLLLSQDHRGRLTTRSQVPRPLSTTVLAKPIVNVIRPVLAILQQNTSIIQVKSQLQSISQVLEKAEIKHTLRTDLPNLMNCDTVDKMTGFLTEMPLTKFTISLPRPEDSTMHPVDTNIKHNEEEVMIEFATLFNDHSYGLRSDVKYGQHIRHPTTLETLQGCIYTTINRILIENLHKTYFEHWLVNVNENTIIKPFTMKKPNESISLQLSLKVASRGKITDHSYTILQIKGSGYDYVWTDTEEMSSQLTFDAAINEMKSQID